MTSSTREKERQHMLTQLLKQIVIMMMLLWLPLIVHKPLSLVTIQLRTLTTTSLKCSGWTSSYLAFHLLQLPIYTLILANRPRSHSILFCLARSFNATIFLYGNTQGKVSHGSLKKGIHSSVSQRLCGPNNLIKLLITVSISSSMFSSNCKTIEGSRW